MKSVFVSSIQAGFEAERAAARGAIESLAMRPLMAESAGASDASPRRALLDLVAAADVFLLVIGPRYSKPTEDEFHEAVRLGKPILVLVQSGDRDRETVSFIDRVSTGWVDGRLRDQFSTPHELTLAVVHCLKAQDSRPAQEAALQAAAERAHALATSATDRRSFVEHDIAIVVVPAGGSTLLDPVQLGDVALGDSIAAEARKSGLASQTEGLDAKVSSKGVLLSRVGAHGSSSPMATIYTDGSVAAMISAHGDGSFAGTVIDPDRLDSGIHRAGDFAQSVWRRIDSRSELDYVAVALAVAGASSRVFGKSPQGNSISMGGSLSLPATVIAPEPAMHVRAGQLTSNDTVARLLAALRLVFADAGSLV